MRIGWRGLTLALALALALPAGASAQVVFQKIADTSTPIPGGSGDFDSFVTFPSLDGNAVAFSGVGSSGTQQGIYLSVGGQLLKVADRATPVPGGTGNFLNFFSQSLDDGVVAFRTDDGIYAGNGGTPTVLVDETTTIPGESEAFSQLSDGFAFEGGVLAFAGSGPSVSGVYTSTPGILSSVLDTSTSIPGSMETFDGFGSVSLSGSFLGFLGFDANAAAGIYRSDGASLEVIADSSTAVPGGTGTFENLAAGIGAGPSMDGDDVAFWGRDSAIDEGIFFYSGGALAGVAKQGDPIPDETDDFIGFQFAVSTSAGNVAFNGSGPSGQGIYLARAGILTRLVRTDDMLDGKQIDTLLIGQESLSGSRLAFQAGFHDGSAGIFVASLPCPAEPVPSCVVGFGKGSIIVDERKTGRERLVAKLSQGPALGQDAFGDPTAAGGTAASLCIYDDAGTLVEGLALDRAGQSCGGKPCWKPIGKPAPDGKGFAYKDPSAATEGVRTLRLAGGASASLAAAAGNRSSKGQLSLPTGIAAELASATSVTLQIHAIGTACFSATLAEIQKQEPDLFKAR